MGIVTFFLTGLIFILHAVLAAYLAGGNSFDRFWTASAAFYLQIGLVAVIGSILGSLEPAMWLTVGLVYTLLVFLFMAVVCPSKLKGFFNLRWSTPNGFVPRVSHLCFLLFLVPLVGYIFLRFHVPVHRFDELMYHASRSLYWLQAGSVFPFESHNIRHNAFTFGSDLWFLFSIAHLRSEVGGTLFFFLQLPLALCAVWGLLSSLGVQSNLIKSMALTGILLMPLLLRESMQLKPEVGMIWALSGFSYYFSRIVSEIDDDALWLRLCAYSFIGVSYKLTFASVLPLILFLVLLRLWKAGARVRFVVKMACAALLFSITSTFMVTLYGNFLYYDSITGPKLFAEDHRATMDLRTISTHLARAPFVLVGLPWVPVEQSRHQINRLGERMVESSPAGKTLPGENVLWPGSFEFYQPRWDERFSLYGILGSGAVLFLFFRWISRRDRFRNSALMFPALVALPSIFYSVGIILFVRWQSVAALPDRFLLPSVVLSSALFFFILSEWVRGFSDRWKTLAGILFVIGFCWSLMPGFREGTGMFLRILGGKLEMESENNFFQRVSLKIPPGSTVLLIAGQTAGDYYLFRPADDFSNAVVPWGMHAFSEDRLVDVIQEYNVTHVVLESLFHARYDHFPPLPLLPFFNFFRGSREWVLENPEDEMPLLFSRVQNEPPSLSDARRQALRLPRPERHNSFHRRWYEDDRWGGLWLYGNGWKRSQYKGFFDDARFPEIHHDSVLISFIVHEINAETGRITIEHDALGWLASVADDVHTMYQFREDRYIIIFHRRFFPGDLLDLNSGEYFNLDLSSIIGD
ncbi:MAG: hypothetical protein JJT96_15480 [Opitutales bacterium]|nr:hypothetical protein [Opitutales bacterium]